MKTKNMNPVMHEGMVTLNDIIAVKLSALGKAKREVAKMKKEQARYIKSIWDSLEDLEKFDDVLNDDFGEQRTEEIDRVLSARIEELRPKTKKQTEEGKKSVKETKAKTAKRTERMVGDLHPNGLWIWTEYREGKFDWRVRKEI